MTGLHGARVFNNPLLEPREKRGTPSFYPANENQLRHVQGAGTWATRPVLIDEKKPLVLKWRNIEDSQTHKRLVPRASTLLVPTLAKNAWVGQPQWRRI